MRIENSVFLITGAGSGLGLASARELVGRGANVVLVDVNEAAGVARADELGKRAIFVRADITSEIDCRLARDLARSGIRVMCIAPGIFETPMMAGMPRDVQESLAANVPFPPRLGRPSEYAVLAANII